MTSDKNIAAIINEDVKTTSTTYLIGKSFSLGIITVLL